MQQNVQFFHTLFNCSVYLDDLFKKMSTNDKINKTENVTVFVKYVNMDKKESIGYETQWRRYHIERCITTELNNAQTVYYDKYLLNYMSQVHKTK